MHSGPVNSWGSHTECSSVNVPTGYSTGGQEEVGPASLWQCYFTPGKTSVVFSYVAFVGSLLDRELSRVYGIWLTFQIQSDISNLG